MKKFLQHRKGVFVLLLALFLGMGTAYAYDFSATCPSGQTLYYNITDATNHYVEITCPGTPNEDGWQGFTKPTGNITLPSEATYNSVTYTVTKIGDYAFYECSGLTGTLNISATVTTIGHFAFANCYGFTGPLTIPNSVTLIGHYAFMNCQGFTGSLTIPNSVTLIDYGAFRECYGFTGSLTIGSSVTTISNYAFANCSSFTSMMVLPGTPPSLGINVFENVPTSIPVYVPCDQVSAYQNASGWSSFNDMQCLDILTYSINDDGVSVTVTGNLYGTAATGPLVIPETKTIDGVTYTVTAIGQNAFLGCSGFTGNLAIPNSVTTIGFQAFAECSGFTGSLSIPNSVTTIDFGAFGWCPNFTGTLTLPNSLTVIGNFAFYLDSGFTGMLTIPDSVTSIGESAFSSCSFTGLTLGNSLTTIGKHAFHACHTFTGPLTIPNSVTTIGSHAFYACDHFTSLTLGNSVTTIDSWAFNSCDGLKGSLTIPNSVTTIGDSAFGWCQGFNGTLTIGTGVTSMGASVFDSDDGFTEVIYNAINCANVEYTAKPFEGCGGSLTIGNAVQRIPSSMFLGCTGFTSLTIGNSVTSIGWRAFDGCSGFTGSLVIPNSVTEISDYAFRNCSGFTGSLTLGSSLTSIGDLAFGYCGFTGTLSIPNSVTTIGQAAFYECTGLTGELIIPGSVIQIQNSAFYGCTGFTGLLTIPNFVTLIGNYAFCGCSGFTGMLTIGASVSSIGNDAFNGCTGLTSMMVYPETPPTLGSNAFYSMPTTALVKVPCGKLSTYQSASGWNAFSNMQEYCDPLTYSINADGVSVTVTGHVDGTSATGELFIPETKIINGVSYTVTAIGDHAFYNCSGLTGSLTIPNTVTSIDNYAFDGCSGFTGSLTLSNSLTTLGRYCFADCTGFTGNLVIPNTVTFIDEGAFAWSTGFNGTLTLSNNLTTISKYAFYYVACTGSLTIPNSVTTIGLGAFGFCNGFTSLSLGNSVTTIGGWAFTGCTNLTGTLTIPSSVTSIGESAFQNDRGFTQVEYNAINCANISSSARPFEGCTATTLTIGNSVQRIPNYLFFECSNFTGSLTIPNSVTSIGIGAFRNCTGFTGSLTLGNSLVSLDVDAFTNSKFTGPLTIPNSVTTLSMYAFWYCTGFTSLTIGSGVTSIGKRAFGYCSSITQINYNAINCADVAEDTKPFEGCAAATSLTIGSNVTRIPAYMFFQCSNFTGSLSIPNSVTSIGNYAFAECYGFNSSLSLGNSLTTIGNFALYGINCTGTLNIPESVTTIGDFAFAWCQSFTALTINNSVTTIGNSTFYKCINLASLTVHPEIPPTLGNGAFEAVPTGIPVYVPCGSISNYQAASGWSNFTNYQCLPWTVTLTANPNGGGSMTGAGTYANGTSCTVTATPYSNYQFMHWSKNGTLVSCNATYSFTVIEDTELEAVFMPLENAGTVIGEGENTSVYLPSYSYYKYGLTEQIYRRVELSGITTITSISFFNEGATKTRTYDIYLMHTTRANFDSTTDWIPVSSSDKVYSGSVTMKEGLWTTIELDTPFSYNGSNNLLLVVDDNTGTYTNSPHMKCRVFDATNDFHELSNQTLRIISDNTNYDPSSPSSYTGVLMTVKNQIILNRPVYTITVTTNDASMGTVTGGGQYGYGDLCRLKATASSGHTFLDWMRTDGVAVSDEGEYEFIVTGDRTLRANFFEGTDVCNLTFNFENYDHNWGSHYLEVHFGNGMSHLFGVLNGEQTATFTLPLINGSHVELNMQNGTFSDQYPFEVRYANGNLACASAVLTGESSYKFDMDCEEMPAAWAFVGNGNGTTNNYLPSFSYYNYGLSQQIYTANEIGTAGNISSIAFYNQGNNNTKTRTYDIYLKPTNKFEFVNEHDWISISEEDKVFSGSVTMVCNEWTVITFDKPFVYDGTSNLVLVMDDNSGNYSTPHMACRIYNANGDQSLYIYSDGTNYDPIHPSAYIGTLMSKKNQVYFGFTSSIDCWTPTFLTTTDITSYSATLAWTSYQDSYNLRYRVAPPFYEDFEDEETFAVDWTFISNNNANDIGVNVNSAGFYTAAYSGTHGFRFSSYHYAEDGEDYNQYLVSSQLTTMGELKFYAMKSSNNAENLYVGYSTTSDDLDAFTWSDDLGLTTSWVEYTQELPENVKYIAFHYYGDYKYYVYLDDITIGDNDIPIGQWINVNNIAGTTTDIVNLDPSTNYLWQVRGNNTSCNDNGHTQWSKKASFATRCGAVYVDAGNPFFEGFEDTDFAPDCWENYSTGSYQWIRNTNSTYVYSGSTSAYSQYYGDNYLVLPDIELSANAPTAQFTFWSINNYTNYFVAGNNTVVLLNGGNETVLWSAETASDVWEETTIDLSAYLGQTITLAFKYAGYNGNDWYVDDVEVSAAPATSVTQTIELVEGWNWVSIYIDMNGVNGLEMLEDALGDYGVTIATFNDQAEYIGDGLWLGLEDYQLTNNEMIMIEVNADCTVTLQGLVVNPESIEITINPGWNWIGFPMASEMTIEDALGDFDPEFGDGIANIGGLTEYLGVWDGDFATLIPGQGYMYYSERDYTFTFIFQTGGSKARVKAVSPNKTKNEEKPRPRLDDKQ